MLRTLRGFSVIELLFVLIIAATISVVAIPAFSGILHSQELASTSSRLFGAFMLARSEAIKRQAPVLIESIDADWSNGWSVYVDLNSNGSQDEDEPVLLQATDLPDALTIRGNAPVRRYVRYTPDGSAKLKSGAFQAGTISICSPDSQQQVRNLILSATGRLRRSRAAASTCP